MHQATSHAINAYGQPVGPALPAWTPRERLSTAPMVGRFCRLEAFDSELHLQGLYDAYAEDDGSMWTYLPWGPIASPAALSATYAHTERHFGFQRFVIIDPASSVALGEASYMRHALDAGSVEVGGVTFGPRLRRTPAATQAMYLMMRRVFESGYRRYEWRCDALNAPSRRAAVRLGFSLDGVFRHDQTHKRRSHDTAWFSVIADEWPILARAFGHWLEEANFDGSGRQRQSLGSFLARERME